MILSHFLLMCSINKNKHCGFTFVAGLTITSYSITKSQQQQQQQKVKTSIYGFAHPLLFWGAKSFCFVVYLIENNPKTKRKK